MANNYNYNPYNNTNYYAQKMQNLQGRKEQTDKQIQDLQNMLQMQQQMQHQIYPQQPQIQQTFQLSNPTNGLGDFDAKYAENIEEIKSTIVYRNTLFVNKNMNKMYFKDASGNIKIYKLTEMIEKDDKDLEIDRQKNEIDELKNQIKQLSTLVSQQQNIVQEPTVEISKQEIPIQSAQSIAKIEPIKKITEKKNRRG